MNIDMDPFEDDRSELTGSLVTLEFGSGGRVTQLWASDPSLPDEGEDFQFVLPPVQFGEENSDDYLPGTILIGARTGPEQPWIVSRNSNAQQVFPFNDEDLEPGVVVFDYEFPTLEDIQGRGKWYELSGSFPQIVWELEIKNRGKISIEIGELGFPLAFNNFYDGFGWSDAQLKKLWNSRLYVHKFVGGAASWVFAQRMTAETPGLLVFPGEGTGWEFFAHVPASINTPFQWEGIPIVYAYSKATLEREQWPNWANEHTSLILEPGDSRTLRMCFVPCESDKQEGILHTLVGCQRPAIRLLPSAVAPIDVGIGVEISGASPKQFFLSREAKIETDFDEDGAFCFLRPDEPGPLRVSFHDKSGVLCHIHLMFTDPLEKLIKSRAKYIADCQIVTSKGRFEDAIVLANIAENKPVTSSEEYEESSGIECGLADALYLAEKNAIYPESAEIRLLDAFIDGYLLDDIQNPSSLAVGSVFDSESGPASHFGRPLGYPHVFNIYHSMFRVSKAFGETNRTPAEYLTLASRTALAMFRHGWRLYVRTVGVLGFARLYDLLEDLKAEGLEQEAIELEKCLKFKANELMKLEFPYAGESVLDSSGFEEVFAAAKYMDNDEHLERTVRCAFATRSIAPSWWWYGSDKRCWDGADSTPLRALVDKGEACLAHTTIPNSLIFFGLLDKDYLALPEAYMRMAFGGLLGPWSLVRRDGAASMCYCPDLSSKHAGYNKFTGGSGLGYFHYLRSAASYVLPSKVSGTMSFGCHYDLADGVHSIRPWDGVGRKVVMRQIGFEVELTIGKIVELRINSDLRNFEINIQNQSEKSVQSEIKITGLWGLEVEILGQTFTIENGICLATLSLSSKHTTLIQGKVLR